MELTQLIEILSRGEDSRHQFKQKIHNTEALAAEIAAFSNSGGGQIFIGVEDSGKVMGIPQIEQRPLNQLISNASSQSLQPAVHPRTENITHPDGLVVVLTIAEGINKPYMDKNGSLWVKSGADKRKARSPEELQRIFQKAGRIHADQTPVHDLTSADIDGPYFEEFFRKTYEKDLKDQDMSLAAVLGNMNLTKESCLNLAATLLFARSPQFSLPNFIVKAVAYPTEEIHETDYTDSQDITGKIADVFQQTLSFIMSNLPHVQGRQSINSTGQSLVPRLVFEELVANALIHRNYFIDAPVRIFIFLNRIEIISPGHLPNNLSIENIEAGNSNIRNPILASFATNILPYRGLGTGIRRAQKAYPSITLVNDRDRNLFSAIIRLPPAIS